MTVRSSLFSVRGIIGGLTVTFAVLLALLMQKLSCIPGWGGGGGAGAGGEKVVPQAVSPWGDGSPRAQARAEPLQITIDDAKYRVLDTPVESVGDLVKLALAVPKDVKPARVVILREPTARYSAEKNLCDALDKEGIEYVKK